MILGIAIGIVFMVLLILAFAVGLGWNSSSKIDE